MYVRNLSAPLLEALADTPVVLINGARQTGKSTLARMLAAGEYPARYLTLRRTVGITPPVAAP